MNPDMTCRGFQYQVGKVYKHKDKISMCRSGFHFSRELKDCYEYYSFDYKNVVCEVIGRGNIEEVKSKIVCNTIEVVRILGITEILDTLNLFTSRNRGSRNSGSYNRGSRNSGSYNRGSYNRGSYNRGSYNRGSYNRGSDNRGSDNRGMYNFGSHSAGVMNYISFVGEKNNCYCFNRPTGLSLIQFYRRNMEVLKQIRTLDFSNVDKLPNYNDKDWNLIREYLYD